jgi:exodeoxyribonuclease V alpha subunit
VSGWWETFDDGPPVDPETRELHVALSPSGARWVSADGEFAIWSASLGEEGDGAAITLRGALGHVQAGENLVVAGAVEQHPRYGWQFAVESFRSALPQSAEGVALWLRRRVPGIGPTFARAIVDHFGADRVFAELDSDPDRLREVRTKAGRAISLRAVERAVAAWREVAAIREVETFLFAHGIGAGLAARLVRTYGQDTIAVLTDDPYRLTEVPRIGFRVADRIARSLGIEPDAPQRLRAGLLFALGEAASDGNVFLPLAELWSAAGRLLEVHDLEPLESALAQLEREGEVALEGERVYLARLHETECRLAADLARRGSAVGEELFERPPRPEALDVSDEQWAVVELVRTRSLVLLTGLPGAGKTHTQRVLVDAARRAGVRVLLCAPTGKAARRMRDLTGHDAMTIHRALGYSPQDDRFLRDEDDPLSSDVELVIVDEASMLSLELADALFRAADCHVLLVGDTDQLPPIGPGRVLADLVDCEAVPRVHLTAIYRQAARSLIVRSARRINRGEPPYLSLEEARADLGEAELDEDFFWVSRSGPETLREAVLELVCEALPRQGFDPRTEVMTLVPMRRGTVGLVELNAELEARLNPRGREGPPRGLRVGSRIVQTRNDYTPDREVMNGEVAFVLDWDDEEAEALLSLDEGEREIRVPAAALETYELAWALTVHRAQGSQFPAVVAPWSMQYAVMLSRPLLYTAVTRAQRLCVLAGERRALQVAVARGEGRKRWSALAERIAAGG